MNKMSESGQKSDSPRRTGLKISSFQGCNKKVTKKKTNKMVGKFRASSSCSGLTLDRFTRKISGCYNRIRQFIQKHKQGKQKQYLWTHSHLKILTRCSKISGFLGLHHCFCGSPWCQELDENGFAADGLVPGLLGVRIGDENTARGWNQDGKKHFGARKTVAKQKWSECWELKMLPLLPTAGKWCVLDISQNP